MAWDRILASLGDAELHHACGLDLDRLARRGITSHASLTIHQTDPSLRYLEATKLILLKTIF